MVIGGSTDWACGVTVDEERSEMAFARFLEVPWPAPRIPQYPTAFRRRDCWPARKSHVLPYRRCTTPGGVGGPAAGCGTLAEPHRSAAALEVNRTLRPEPTEIDDLALIASWMPKAAAGLPEAQSVRFHRWPSPTRSSTLPWCSTTPHEVARKRNQDCCA